MNTLCTNAQQPHEESTNEILTEVCASLHKISNSQMIAETNLRKVIKGFDDQKLTLALQYLRTTNEELEKIKDLVTRIQTNIQR